MGSGVMQNEKSQHVVQSKVFPVQRPCAQNSERTSEREPVAMISFSRHNAFYSRIEQLVQDIVLRLTPIDPKASLTFNKVTRSVRFEGSGQYRIRMTALFCYMLGMKQILLSGLSDGLSGERRHLIRRQ